jgi:hypothetical protein
MKKIAYLTIILVAIILSAIVFLLKSGDKDSWMCVGGEWIKHGNPILGEPISGCGEEIKKEEVIGTIKEFTESALVITSVSGEKIFEHSSSTVILNSEMLDVDPTFIRPGFDVAIEYQTGSNEKLSAKEINIIKEPDILVYFPIPNQDITSPFEIIGEARVFENVLNYRITDYDGTILAENMAYANSSDVGLYGRFDITAKYSKPGTETGYVEVFDYSAKDGKEIDKVVVPVKFKQGVETMKINVFYGSQILNPQALDCSKVYPRERTIPKTKAVAQAALEELLAGPDSSEIQDGYYSSINSGVKLHKITIENGIAMADFDKTLDFEVGGSCRVTAIRSQITQTLMQFPTVKKVIISIDGRTGDILQP